MSTIAPASAAARPIEEVAEGIFRLDLPVPFKGLRQINLWFLRDGAGWTMVDCGCTDAPSQAAIEAAWAALPGGGPVSRLIITHFHPDHVGNMKWISDRWGLVPFMSAREWHAARVSADLEWLDSVPKQSAFFARHGLSEEGLRRYREEFLTYDKVVELGNRVQTLTEGATVLIDGAGWQVLTAGGHSPEMVMLHQPDRGILISGDQLLPRISSNISVGNWNPEADPLQDYIASLRRLSALLGPADLVLPSHGRPFVDGAARAEALLAHHEERLAKMLAALQEAGRMQAAAFLPVLFSPGLDGTQIGFAMGEVAAHLNHLVRRGHSAASVRADGSVAYVALAREDATELQV
jgi:glyoxylase-like metal-dependent hydrolase (beta-lactamase superfamily II)